MFPHPGRCRAERGRQGGGASLTEFGHAVVHYYRAVESAALKAAAEHIRALSVAGPDQTTAAAVMKPRPLTRSFGLTPTLPKERKRTKFGTLKRVCFFWFRTVVQNSAPTYGYVRASTDGAERRRPAAALPARTRPIAGSSPALSPSMRPASVSLIGSSR